MQVRRAFFLLSSYFTYTFPKVAIAQELAAERNVVEELAGKYLIQAVFSGDINVIETLLKRGYNKNEAAGGHSAIVWASMVGNKDVIDTLLRYGADSTGLLASLAAQSDSKLLANYMHLDLDSPDSHGYYPIHRAILCGTVFIFSKSLNINFYNRYTNR